MAQKKPLRFQPEKAGAVHRHQTELEAGILAYAERIKVIEDHPRDPYRFSRDFLLQETNPLNQGDQSG